MATKPIFIKLNPRRFSEFEDDELSTKYIK